MLSDGLYSSLIESTNTEQIMAKDNLTNMALDGYHGASNPHLWSSPAWYAHELGAYFNASGRSSPFDVRMSRGDSIRANALLFKFTHNGNSVRFERLQ